jgi:hypothetical protein
MYACNPRQKLKTEDLKKERSDKSEDAFKNKN